MMTGARAWLPDTALGLERARAVLEPALAVWAERWLGTAARVVVKSVGARETSPDPRALQIGDAASGPAILLPARGKRLLLETVCAVDLAAVELGLKDHALIDAMAIGIAEDLIAALGTGDVGGEPDVVRLSLGLALNGRDLLTIEVSRPWLAAEVRTLVSPSRARSPRLARRRAAIGASPVTIDALLGRGSLSLAELHSLAPGDVVLLDRNVAQGVELVVAASARSLAHGALGRDGTQPTICL